MKIGSGLFQIILALASWTTYSYKTSKYSKLKSFSKKEKQNLVKTTNIFALKDIEKKIIRGSSAECLIIW